MSAVLALAARAQARAGCTLAMSCRSATPSLRHVAAPCAATVLRRGAWTTAGASGWLHIGTPAASSKGHEPAAGTYLVRSKGEGDWVVSAYDGSTFRHHRIIRNTETGHITFNGESLVSLVR